MRILHSFAASIFLLSSITTAAQAGDPDDPQDFSQDFDFFAAWGVHPNKESGMALLPDESGLPPNEDGLYQFYDVGVSFTSQGDKTPSFQAYGTLEGLELWRLPDEISYGYFDLADFGGADRVADFQGTVEYLYLFFLGRLSTPTGYNEIVTGVLHISRFDFESPEEITVGSMLLLCESEWVSPDDARAHINSTVSALSPIIPMEAYTDDEKFGGDEKKKLNCKRQHSINKEYCNTMYEACVIRAQVDREACLAGSNFYDGLHDAGTAAAVTTARCVVAGAGHDFDLEPHISIPVTSARVTSNAVGGFISICTGFWYGEANARRRCEEKYLDDMNRCKAARDLCLENADARYEDCLTSIEE